jgi:tRNA dimethylallyltransferase
MSTVPLRGNLYIITGCTAVGKTEWALRWAERYDAEIVSCDSLLFYRGMDIGTAKPTSEERARVPHHLIDILGVTETMDVNRYVTLARRTADEIVARGKKVLVAGGSGFYLRVFFSAVTDDVVVPPELRAVIENRLRVHGLPALVAELRRVNPGGLGNLDTANPRRVVRALERCRASGKTLAELAADFAQKPAPFADWEPRLVELERPPEELNQRIALRVEAMLRDGLEAEVAGLLAKGLKDNASAARAIGYRETIDVIEGRMRREELAAAIIQNTKALVKKQRTWFRTQLPAHRSLPAAQASVDQLFDLGQA